MARRLDRTAVRLGIDPSGTRLLVDAFRSAMEPRRHRIREDHHPDYLHPARSMLILMDDAALADADLLAVAAFVETRDRVLAAPEEAMDRVHPSLAERVAMIPLPDRAGDRLLEHLLALPDGLAQVALAERLDHARHLHLRDRAEWVPYHALTCETYAPLAARVHETLASRLDWWCATFRDRFLSA
jgi:(p)ppGpp synthase/HD superfamily hydrolase